MRQCLTVLMIALALSLMPPFGIDTARAGFGDQMTSLTQSISGMLGLSRTKAGDPSGLAAAIQRLKQLAPAEQAFALAMGATDDEHWRLGNASGEIITVASPQELKRALAILLPTAAEKPETQLAIYLTEETAFQFRSQLKTLPETARLAIVVGRLTYPVLRTDEKTVPRYYAQLKPNVMMELAERPAFDAAVQLLERPLERARIRIISMENGAARALRPRPTQDPASGLPQTDRIDPSALISSLGALGGQTAVVTGRIKDDRLIVQPPSGAETSLPMRELLDAGESADVSLILLEAPHQPGARTWIFRTTEVDGLDKALAHATLLDFYNVLGDTYGRLAITSAPQGSGRLQLDAVPLERAAKPKSSGLGAGEILSEVVTQVTGKVSADAIRGNFVSAARQDELARRLIPGIPSWLQAGYVALMLLGLVGSGVAYRWWNRLWPAERRDDYAGFGGYAAARVLRGALFVLAFLPIVAPASAFMQLARFGMRRPLPGGPSGRPQTDLSAPPPR